jgi:hypothetical protein
VEKEYHWAALLRESKEREWKIPPSIQMSKVSGESCGMVAKESEVKAVLTIVKDHSGVGVDRL